jgi:geranylgeranyl pyrophosphate synthase
LGAIAAGKGQLDGPEVLDEHLSRLNEFGHRFGIVLQMFDDLGNVTGKKEPAKRWEDLRLRRPSWVWACAAEICSGELFQEFSAAVGKLPDAGPLRNWFQREPQFLEECRERAVGYLRAIQRDLKDNLEIPCSLGFATLTRIEESLIHAYE